MAPNSASRKVIQVKLNSQECPNISKMTRMLGKNLYARFKN